MVRISSIAPRFSSVIPVKQVYCETKQGLLDPDERTDKFRSAVRELDYMYANNFPYGVQDMPKHISDDNQTRFFDEGRRAKDRIWERLALMDDDFAKDPRRRVSTIQIDRQHYVLTADDAQPMIDFWAMPHDTDDVVIEGMIHQEEARIRSHPAISRRTIGLSIRSTPVVTLEKDRLVLTGVPSPMLTDMVAL